VKSTPINIVQRENLDLWSSLFARVYETEPVIGSEAGQVLEILKQQGASFFADIVARSGLIRTRVEAALAELVSQGLVSSDSYTGIRALLSPSNRKQRQGRNGKRRRTPYELENAGRWTVIQKFECGNKEAPLLNDEQLDRLINIYLKRWGVISRKILEKETQAPPWRIVLLKLRRMELQGTVRGGRFIAGIGGEQFALADTVKGLRRCANELKDRQEDKPSRVVINAADPLNLVGIILPGKKIPSLASNRILFEN
jgi:ATP-dependent Lhr-like helicase